MLTPEEYGRKLARQAPPLPPEVIEAAARILCLDDDEPLQDAS